MYVANQLLFTAWMHVWLCINTTGGARLIPPHYSKVSGYTKSTMIAAKTCIILMTCAAVILTDSVNSNMGFLHERASAERPAPAVGRTLAGGYEVFSPFIVMGNELPLLTTFHRVASSVGLAMRYSGQRVCCGG